MKFIILCVVLCSLACTGITSAASDYWFDGDGQPRYPNNGSMWANAGSNTIEYNWQYYTTVYVWAQGYSSVTDRIGLGDFKGYGNAILHATGAVSGEAKQLADCFTTDIPCYNSGDTNFSFTASNRYATIQGMTSLSDWYNSTCTASIYITIMTVPIPRYTISGNVSCQEFVELQHVVDGTWWGCNFTYVDTTDTYEFLVLNNNSYRLLFSDNHMYYFDVDDADRTYDYDTCTYTRFGFEDTCGNLIPDIEGHYCLDYAAGGGMCSNFSEPSGILSLHDVPLSGISLTTHTFAGTSGWTFSPVLNNHTYNCIDPDINWRLKVIVQNLTDGTLINDTTVRVNQSCYCVSPPCTINPDQSCTCSGTTIRQKKTIHGTTSFAEMSLQDASLWVQASGYKVLSVNSTGYNTTLSGKHNFSSKTWVVKLAPSNSNNSSEWYETSQTTTIFFKNEANEETTQIDDTDSLVYLYYNNNNSNIEDMTLRFESSSTHTYFLPEQTWNIPHGEIGRKTIVNALFTPFDYSYRAVMYNSTIYGWNITIPLTVRDADAQANQNYRNLSTFLWFRYELDGKIDYREDMKIGIHACSNNSTLMTLDIELYKDGALLCYKNLSETLLGDDHTYIWEPVFEYESGSVYTAYMYGYDRTLLETEVVECITDTNRKNKITIIVKDRGGSNVYGGTVFLEGYGQTPCNSLYYASFEGMANGEYRYKASKSGYTAAGWNTINISDGDTTVTYVLSQDSASSSGTSEKMSNTDLKGLFFPFMYALLAMIIIGGLKYVLF